MDLKTMNVKSFSDKTVYQKEIKSKKKKIENYNQNSKSTRFLITINVFGSAGPIRFVVNGSQNSVAVIETALKMYAREGRLPILGSDVNSFLLYPAFSEYDHALRPTEEIGSRGVRNFFLCKKETEARSHAIGGKGRGWRAWLQKPFSLKFPSH